MKYILNREITHQNLVDYGFTYRGHYDNFIYMKHQPDTTEIYKSTIENGYNHEEAIKTYQVQQTYIDYAISVNLKTRKVNIWTHALNNFPYDKALHQHNISHEFIELILDLLVEGIIIQEKNLINFDTYKLPDKFKLYDRHKLDDMILDDNCYMNGKECTFKEDIPYIIVVGQRAIGKSQYSKVMSNYNKGIQYYSVQQLEYLDKRIRIGAIKRIMIGVIES